MNACVLVFVCDYSRERARARARARERERERERPGPLRDLFNEVVLRPVDGW